MGKCILCGNEGSLLEGYEDTGIYMCDVCVEVLKNNILQVCYGCERLELAPKELVTVNMEGEYKEILMDIAMIVTAPACDECPSPGPDGSVVVFMTDKKTHNC